MVWKHLKPRITLYHNEESTLFLFFFYQVRNPNKQVAFADNDTALVSILVTTKTACISLFCYKWKFQVLIRSERRNGKKYP